jgi:hypothetical protein
MVVSMLFVWLADFALFFFSVLLLSALVIWPQITNHTVDKMLGLCPSHHIVHFSVSNLYVVFFE